MYKNPRDPENKVITEKVIEWTRAKLGLGENIDIFVSEVGCADASCPCVQTLISIQTDPKQTIRIGKPLIFVRKWDIINYIAPKELSLSN